MTGILAALVVLVVVLFMQISGHLLENSKPPKIREVFFKVCYRAERKAIIFLTVVAFVMFLYGVLSFEIDTLYEYYSTRTIFVWQVILLVIGAANYLVRYIVLVKKGQSLKHAWDVYKIRVRDCMNKKDKVKLIITNIAVIACAILLIYFNIIKYLK